MYVLSKLGEDSCISELNFLTYLGTRLSFEEIPYYVGLDVDQSHSMYHHTRFSPLLQSVSDGVRVEICEHSLYGDTHLSVLKLGAVQTDRNILYSIHKYI